MTTTERPWLGDRVYQLRQEQALTQAELAERAGVSISTIARLERASLPIRARTIRRLARALNVEPRRLTSREA